LNYTRIFRWVVTPTSVICIKKPPAVTSRRQNTPIAWLL